jgi:hypothetical protein
MTELFAPNARRLLDGPRPDFRGQTAVANATPMPGATSGTASPAAGGEAWSKIITSDVLADEVKSYATPIGEQLKSVSAFKGGGFEKLRQYFSVLAVVFGIISEYDQTDVRWKDVAPTARDLFARAGMNAKVATDSTMNEAKLRLETLESMVRGGSIESSSTEATAPWPKIADRPPLMQRLQVAQADRLAAAMSSAGEFKNNIDLVAHEAQVSAALGHIIQQEGYEFADDETYLGYAQELKLGGLGLAEAARQANYEQGVKAYSMLKQSCDNCHGDYR